MTPNTPRPELRVWTEHPAFAVIGLALLTGLAGLFLALGVTMTNAEPDLTPRCGGEEMRPGQVCVFTSGPAPSAVGPGVGDSYADVLAENQAEGDHFENSMGGTYFLLAGIVVVVELIWILRLLVKRRRRNAATFTR